MPPKSSDRNIHVNEDQKSISMDDQDLVLLKALQDLIVHIVIPKEINEVNEITLGPEAKRLITGLRDFVISVAGRSKSKDQSTVVEVSLDEEDNAPENTGNNTGEAGPLEGVVTNDEFQNQITQQVGPTILSTNLNASEDRSPTFNDKVLKGLREYVFNTMPIRMLSFEPHGSIFRISLLERGAIHAHLASTLSAKLNEADLAIMRQSFELRRDTEEEIIKQVLSKHVRYAILSHTWLRTSGEITYDDWNKAQFDVTNPGYLKLVNFCKVAWKDHGLTLGWMDTVCINKESSSELDESIRSMYNWYSRADVCLIYLAETASLADMHTDPWFTRGWTLQELLAPGILKFYQRNWKRIIENSVNDKWDKKITKQIKHATTISQEELYSIHKAPISRRMQLAAKRKVTREEDTAYSLMGIFNVSISTAYGEGAQRAFFRLLQEILASTVRILDVLNWAGALPDSRAHPSLILPTSPLHYSNAFDPSSYYDRLSQLLPIEPLTLTHLGLRVPVVLMPAIYITNSNPASPFASIGKYSATVEISLPQKTMRSDIIIPSATYNVLDNRVSGADGLDLWPHNRYAYQITLAVFNFTARAQDITLYSECLAKVLFCSNGVGKVTSSTSIFVIPTTAPVVFSLVSSRREDTNTAKYSLPRNELARHGNVPFKFTARKPANLKI